MNDEEKVALRQEILRESYAEIVFGFLRYFRENNIDEHDKDNPIVLLFDISVDIYKNIFVKYDILEEMIEVQGQYKLLKKILEEQIRK